MGSTSQYYGGPRKRASAERRKKTRVVCEAFFGVRESRRDAVQWSVVILTRATSNYKKRASFERLRFGAGDLRRDAVQWVGVLPASAVRILVPALILLA